MQAFLRILVGAVVIVPIILIFLFNSGLVQDERSGSAPSAQLESIAPQPDVAEEAAQRDEAAAEAEVRVEAEREIVEAKKRRETAALEQQAKEKPKAARTDDKPAAYPSASRRYEYVPPPAPPITAAKPPAISAPAAPGNLESLPIGGARAPAEAAEQPSVETAASAEPAAANQDWTIVPVFFGTDRQRTVTTERVTYDWQRGRKLDLGRALVTVPKNHEVPMVERPWALTIPYLDITLYQEEEDPKKHFTIKEIQSLPREEFLALVRARLEKSARFKDHALVFIHGYKNTFDNAVYRTAQIAYDLKFDGAPFLYSWPSGGTLQGYNYDRESTTQSEPHLKEFLELVSNETGAKKISIIAHSMGNQLLLRVLQDLKRTAPEGLQISQLILAAPDVDRDSFENIVSSIEGIAEGITLYAAANDTALMVSRQVNGGVPRAGDVPEGGPVVIAGVDTIDATATSMDSVGINHSGYAENNALLSDIARLIGEGIRPPGMRLPSLQQIDTDKGPYWKYPAPQNR